MTTTPKIILIPGSSRSGSWNAKLAGTIDQALAVAGAETTRISLADYDMPIYNGDLEQNRGVPADAKKLGHLIAQHHGVVLVCPEYNGSITPLLKNTIDWLSRDLGEAKPFADRVFALTACSPGALGGLRGLAHMRDVLVALGADMVTPQLAVGSANSAFNEDETLANDRHQGMLDKVVDAMIERASFLARA